MDDRDIVPLYWERSDRAIPETERKYGAYCTRIACNILGDRRDAEECVNDAYLKLWNSIPPHRPSFLKGFVGKIVRNLSINRYNYGQAAKRGGGELEAVLDELTSVVSDSVEQEIDRRELIKEINCFLGQLSAKNRSVFLCRYWYFESIASIAARFGMRENNVSVTLARLRDKLKKYLSERGFEL